MPAQTNVMTFCPAGTRTSIYAGTAFYRCAVGERFRPPAGDQFFVVLQQCTVQLERQSNLWDRLSDFSWRGFHYRECIDEDRRHSHRHLLLVSIFRPDLGGTQPANPEINEVEVK